MVAPSVPSRNIPVAFPIELVPVTSVPMKLPETVFDEPPLIITPAEELPEMTFLFAYAGPPTTTLVATLA